MHIKVKYFKPILRFSGMLTAMKKSVSKKEKYAESESEVKVPVRIAGVAARACLGAPSTRIAETAYNLQAKRKLDFYFGKIAIILTIMGYMLF